MSARLRVRVGILASDFPAWSETFVMDHAKALVERGLDLRIIANGCDDGAWSSLGAHESTLRRKVIYYGLPAGRAARACGAAAIITQNLLAARWEYGRGWNRWSAREASIYSRQPYVLDAARRCGRVDVLHCHFGPNGVVGASIKRMGLARKLVVTFHGYDVANILRDQRRHPYQRVFEEADLLLPVSERWRERLIHAGAPSGRTLVHRMGVDMARFKLLAPPGDTVPLRLITTARLQEKKGVRYAIEAVGRIVGAYPDIPIHFDIIGEGPQRSELESLIRNQGLRERIHLHGALAHEGVLRMLERAHVFVLPSVTAESGDQEGIPVALMEAMACGLPVLSTYHSGIPELVEEGVSGYLVPERDVVALADRIVHLAQNPSRRVDLGRAGRARVECDYNLARQNDGLVEMYRELLELNDDAQAVPDAADRSLTRR